MNQSVIVFSNEAARTAAIPSPIEGMVTYLEDTDALQLYTTSWGPVATAPKILQVVSEPLTAAFSHNTSGMQNITGLAATITPTSNTSKVLVMLNLGTVDCATSSNIFGDVIRGATPIGVGDVAGSRIQAGWFIQTKASDEGQSCAWSFLDSPATTSATTYQARIQRSGTTVFVNRTSTDSNTGNVARSISTITLMEVAV